MATSTGLEIYEDRILGKGGSGIVYQGYLHGEPVAIRQSSTKSNQSDKADQDLRKLNGSENVIKWLHVEHKVNLR